MSTKIPMIIPPPSSVAQLAILMIDGSGSMSDSKNMIGTQTKLEAVMEAASDFLVTLKESKIRDSFWFSICGFSVDCFNLLSNYKRSFVKVTDLDFSYVIDPANVIQDRSLTDIALALERAKSIADEFRRDPKITIDGKYRRAYQ